VAREFSLDNRRVADYYQGFGAVGQIVLVLAKCSCIKRLAQERGFWYMLKVKSRAGESVQQMMRRFKKLCEKEGLIRDMKRTAYYEKPSERNRRRMRKAKRVAGVRY